MIGRRFAEPRGRPPSEGHRSEQRPSKRCRSRLHPPKIRSSRLGPSAAAALLAVLAPFTPSLPARAEGCSPPAGALTISMIDVGLGEALLLTCPDSRTHALIDGGDTDEHYPGAPDRLHRALGALVPDRRIETVLLTHPHPDHVGGLVELLRRGDLAVNRLVEQGVDFTGSELDEALRREAGIRSLPVLRPDSPDALALCPDSTVRVESLVLPEQTETRLGCPENLNDCSVKLRLTFGGQRALLLADATSRWEEAALGDPTLRARLRAEVLKVGHHGSEHGTTPALAAAVAPALSLVSVGDRLQGRSPELGYPAARSLETLRGSLAPDPARSLFASVRAAGGFEWKKVSLPREVLATPVDGTIHVSLRPDGSRTVCSERY